VNVAHTKRLLTDWCREHLGAEVTGIRQQARWRPVWFVDVDRDGDASTVMVRGDRTDAAPLFPLDHEMRFQELLEADGIPVAHVYGWVDEPRAFVIDVVPGENNFDAATDDERARVMDEYMGILARIHQLDPEPYARAGITRAPTPRGSGRVGLDVYVAGYRATKVRPDPFLEFCLGWIDRNPVDTHGREAPIVWDSGQFHHQDGGVTAILDLELGHLGDPMMDLAAFRMRDTVLGFGDMNLLYDQYAKHSGVPVDLDAIMHHHFVFALTNQLVFHAALAAPPAASDYMTNMQWASETNLFALEGLAEIMGVDELDRVEVPEPRESPVANAHEHLVRSLRSLDLADGYERNQLRVAFRLARHLQRFDEIGDACTDADLDDLKAFLGSRPATWQEGDAALEEVVLADGGAHDEELLQLFHRRYLRYKLLCGPEGSAMARHEPIQKFHQRRAPSAQRS
jgi:aminoglycoside phosphotransferase (APT) family kinase protein